MESVTRPWTRPAGPDAPTKADARMNAAIANVPTAIQLETQRWSVGGADMANTRPGKGPRHRCVGSESLKVSGEIIAHEAQVGDPSSAESKDPRPAFGGSGRSIWTIGHSTRSLEEFVALLGEHRLLFLADVRHFPTSKRVPWTAKASLSKALSDLGIAYEHFEDLGGFRKARPDSVDTGCRDVGLSGYADYMRARAFSVALARLITFAADRP